MGWQVWVFIIRSFGVSDRNAAMDIATIMDGFGRCHGMDRTFGARLTWDTVVISGWTLPISMNTPRSFTGS